MAQFICNSFISYKMDCAYLRIDLDTFLFTISYNFFIFHFVQPFFVCHINFQLFFMVLHCVLNDMKCIAPGHSQKKGSTRKGMCAQKIVTLHVGVFLHVEPKMKLK